MRLLSILLCCVPLAACQRNESPSPAPAAAATNTIVVAAAAETAATRDDGANDVRLWLHPTDAARSLILGAAGTGGLEVYGLDGKRRQQIDGISTGYVDVRYGFDMGEPVTLILAHDGATASLVPYTVDPETSQVTPLRGKSVPVAAAVAGLCSFRSPITGKLYAVVVTDEGTMQQWALFARSGAFDAALVRTVPLGKGAGYCVADDEAGMLYVADETLGLFRIAADPEADTERTAVDLVAPYGRIDSEPKGLALVRTAEGAGYLVAADGGAQRFHLYALDGRHLGAFEFGAGPGADAVGESEGIAFAPLRTEAYPAGVLAVTDQDNEGGFSNFKLVSWRAVLQAAGASADANVEPSAEPGSTTPAAKAATGAPAAAALDPRQQPAPSARTVRPRLETPPALSYGDAADDPAIWVNPADARRSAVIATDKKYGLYVYDLDGRTLQTLKVGRVNNVDLRDGFAFADGPATIVAADNRTDKTLLFWRFDARTRQLEARVAAPIPTGLGDPYGVCMYRSARSGDYFVFVNDEENGRYRQWRLTPDGRNVTAEPVREFTVGSIAEGCVADDETGALYVAEENVGVWKYQAEPDGGEQRTQLDKVGGPNPLVADVEGMGIYRQTSGRGYLVLSNQGANNYAVYRRDGDNAFVGTFHVVADDSRGIDGSSETDGLDVVSNALGPAFPRGLLVVQDGRNISPGERQNFKYVDWADVAAVLGLE